MAFCAKCGASIREDDCFCPNCGASIKNGQNMQREENYSAQSGAATNRNADNTATQENENASEPFLKAGDGSTTERTISQTEEHKHGKRHRKWPWIVLGIFVLLIVVFMVMPGKENAQDQKVAYEGIMFSVPQRWKPDSDVNSDAGLYFYTQGKNSGEMLCMTAVPDVSSVLSLLGADYLMDWMTEYIQAETGGETVSADKRKVAGYDAYVFDVTGVSKDANGDKVQGGYRLGCIINTDNAEMILVCAVGLSAEETDEKVLSDLDYILEHAVVTKAENTY